MRTLWDILAYMTKDKIGKIWEYNEEKYMIIDSTVTCKMYVYGNKDV